MNLLKKLFSDSPGPSPTKFYSFKVRCDRCGEVIEGRIHPGNELSVDYDQGGESYSVRKTLMGSGRCFQRIDVELKFNAARQLVEKHAHGGVFVD